MNGLGSPGYWNGYGKGKHAIRISGLRIETYFRQIEKIIDACPVIQLSNVTYEKRGTHEGFIPEKLCFADGFAFYLREFVDVEMTLARLMYASINSSIFTKTGISL